METMDKPAPTQGPPFSFDGVTSRVFPLRAYAHALQRLCDTYLNLFPEQVYFRPSAPYVLLTLLNYGRMSYSTEAAAHYGWVSQNEVYFGVPLDWGRLENGRWTPLGSGVVTPFIFVDQPWSIEVGREVYGWPKEPAEFLRTVNTWASGSPADRESLLTLATQTFLTPFASEQPSTVPLVEIDRAAPLSIGPSLWQAPLSLDNPWWGGLTLWRESMRIWSGAAFPDAAMYVPLMLQASRLLFGGSSPAFYTANLKQVRSLENPAIAAYQAITMAPIRLTALHRAGMLGEGRILLGDPTGGYRVHIQRHPLFPIIETLGLVVSSEEHHSDARDVAIRGYTAGVAGNTRLERFPGGLTSSDEIEHGVATLAPLFPFWLEADLEYGRGDTVSWSSRHIGGGAWHRRARAAPDTATTWVASASASASASGDGLGASLGASPGLFDPTWGARALPAPPYYYPQLTMRLLALPATPDLAGIVAALDAPPEVGSFRLLEPPPGQASFPPRVVMMVTTSEEMGAQINSAGWWWKRQVSFYVPVIWTRNGKEMVALVSMATFADSEFAATTAREIGPEVIAADLYAPPDSWLDFAGPRADRRLLWLATNVLPALDVDAEAKQRVLLEVLALDQHIGDCVPVMPPAAAPEDTRLCIVARRRIRDATDPEQYAYEEWFSQNLISRNIGPTGWQSSTAAIEVRIHQYPDRLDLVGRLALDVDRLEHGKSQHPGRGWEGAIVNVIPTRFAWANLDVTQECNTSLAVRNHGGPWTAPVRPAGATPCEPQVNDAFYRLVAGFVAEPDPERHG
jgi:hypothetical protein